MVVAIMDVLALYPFFFIDNTWKNYARTRIAAALRESADKEQKCICTAA